MTEHPDVTLLPDVIERFLDEPVTAPSLTDLRAAGAAAVRRRRRRGLVGALAAVVLVAGGVAVSQATLDGRGEVADDPVPPADATTLDPPPGTRWAGVGRVVMAVPSGWRDHQSAPCRPSVPAVYFPSTSTRRCIAAMPASSLLISDRPLGIDREAPRRLVDGVVDGHDVQMSYGCLKSRLGPCFAEIGVPDLDAYFRVSVYALDAEARVDAIRDSLTVLPQGQVAVPLVDSWRRDDVDAAVADMRALGLEPTVEEGCNDAGLCMLSAWTDPPAGRVVETGTPVTIYVVGWDGGPY